jgi:hypothetical protein
VKRILIAFSALSMFAVAACSNSAKLLPCGTDVNVPYITFNMIYPSPGATGVPDNLGAIDFAGDAEIDTPISLSAGATSITLEALQPVPSPAPTPTPQNGYSEWSAAIPAPSLSASTTYTVKTTYTVTGTDCSPSTQTRTYGSFTTQ